MPDWGEGCAYVVDARGLNCPLPLLKTKKALALAAVGERILLQATDPNTLRDVSDYVKQARYTLIEAASRDGIVHMVIEKREPA